jgi:hypothetical protein
MGSTGVSEIVDGTITLNITEPKIPDFVKQEPPKRGRGRPKKNGTTS